MANRKTGKKSKWKHELVVKIKQLFKEFPKRKFNYKQIASLLHVNDSQNRQLIYTILTELADQGELKEVSLGKFQAVTHIEYAEGRIEVTKRGSGYVVIEEGDDIFISLKNRNRALDGDLVKVKYFSRKKSGKPEGEVVEIIESANQQVVGTIELADNYAFLIPDKMRLDVDIFIPKNKIKGLKNGYKAIAKITDWPSDAKNPYGEVIEVLGRVDSNDTEMLAILAANGIPYQFPEEVMREAEQIPVEIPESEIKNRRDFRDVLTFTIDPLDARDFDDAISIKKLDNGRFEVGVHIADVGHYVRPGSALDKEAYQRGNSVYMVDRVVPMLPEHLSNGVCSLRPNEEKLTFAAVFELDEHGKVHHEWFGKTCILSDRRFTYEEAQERIESGEGDLADEIKLLDKIARQLREKRISKGALEITSSEIRFELDDSGAPIGTYKKTTKDANKLVEEYMLLANKKVAKFVGDVTKRKTPIPFIYRIHDTPDEEKVEMFKVFVSKFDIDFSYSHPSEIASQMNKIFELVKEDSESDVIQSMAIRSMAKAVYDTENIGHYGLGFRYYTHFTSPIRRYADLLVHRILFETLHHNNQLHKGLTEMAKHISNTERRAVNAERDSQKYFQAVYLKDKEGDVYPGNITGLTEWGMYVEMEGLNCEGMVALKSINSDRFYFDDQTYQVVGARYHDIYNVGDRVYVKISQVSLAKKQVDLELIEN